MADHLSIKDRSINMSKIKSKDTKPEVILRKFLYAQGFRYRINVKNLLGTPDIVMKKYNLVIFVNGCFWHGHENCSRFRYPKSNKEYWIPKIEKNIRRDRLIKETLMNQGWNVITIWECMLKKTNRENTLNNLSLALSKIVIERYKNLKILD
ncbi:MAG TPA: very short patch repair endonuclease [Paludibacteraceae bacterium]|nr:very short patch repair endonuclease [Paludibacteraceae bacterium]